MRTSGRAWRSRQTADTALVGAPNDLRGFGVGLHALRLDVDPAGRKANRQRRGWFRSVRDERSRLRRWRHRARPAVRATDTYAGAAWVFTRSGSTWTQQGDKLVLPLPPTCVVRAQRGALGRREHYADRRADAKGAWAFVRSGSPWTEQAGSRRRRIRLRSRPVGDGRHGAGRQPVRRQERGRRASIHALRLDVDPAGTEAGRRGPRPEGSARGSGRAWRCRAMAAPRSPADPRMPVIKAQRGCSRAPVPPGASRAKSSLPTGGPRGRVRRSGRPVRRRDTALVGAAGVINGGNGLQDPVGAAWPFVNVPTHLHASGTAGASPSPRAPANTRTERAPSSAAGRRTNGSGSGTTTITVSSGVVVLETVHGAARAMLRRIRHRGIRGT